ncbi:ubiquitin carboxyl-terminal hydrolase CYLD [Lutzomyia longipalpis]|uniref:ubiquitin carboxyl-terminal hydrolase CYLD n=1 Tax=Lutzomyia longipalpis TaxID=7200 RepID=UPI002483410F|nr:ubiquitin carboxyl-terminal hydrolase CYLD [Lutzomyia longipalpis]
MSHSFAVCTKHCQLRLLTGAPSGDEFMALQPGMMLQIRERPSGKVVSVRVYDFYARDLVWENNLFSCPIGNLLEVPSDIWLFLAAIVDPVERLALAQSEARTRQILSLKESDIVVASGAAFRLNASFDAIVRYIGLVPEIGPGYYFGLEILNFKAGSSPQANDLPYLGKYMSCDPSLALVIPANFIEQPQGSHGDSKSFKRSTKGLINGILCLTVDRVQDVKDRYGTLRNSRRSTDKGDPLKRLSLNADVEAAYKARDRSPLSSDSSMDGRKQTPSISSSYSNPNLRRDDDVGGERAKGTQMNGSSTTKTLANSEEYVKYVENYERNLEKQKDAENGAAAAAARNAAAAVAKVKKKPLPPMSGGVKPNTFLSLKDRDIVVIDKADIKESVKNESEVIVLDHAGRPTSSSGEVDLVDILGPNWPAAAGDVAPVLNSEKRPGGAPLMTKNERNRSGNPISHLISTKSAERRQKDNMMRFSEESGSSSFDSSSSSTNRKKQVEPHYDNIPVPQRDEEIPAPSPLSEIPEMNLGLGSVVEVSTDVSEDLYGVIRWIGYTPGNPAAGKSLLVGVELEEDQPERPLTLTDGSYNGVRLFRCPPGRALFIPPSQCSKDRRFQDIDRPSTSTAPDNYKLFGHVECPSVPGSIAPLKVAKPDDLETMCGKFKGIQGHHNSCYLDATLFAMFTFTSVFDSLLFRPPDSADIAHYGEVQKVLREEIVNPLRKNLFVRADRVMKLRQLLDKLSSVTGLMSEEKDPEEFLNSLLAQILRAEPFLKLSSGQDAFYYQLFVEKDERLSFPSVQQLFEQSFLASDIKLKEVPSCLIIQMPRFGKNFKMYPRILPSQVLDVTDIIEDSPRQCTVCGKLAEFECRECFGTLQCGVGLESTAFCRKCLETAHSHTKRLNHVPKEISVPHDFKIMAEHCPVPRLFMELFAVVCIETSHYVAFVKAGSGQDAPWCFFDSMADRKGELNGYNIPEMVSVTDLPQWLSEDSARTLHEAASNDKMLPDHAKRLLCDAYMCMYQSTDVMMYR